MRRLINVIPVLSFGALIGCHTTQPRVVEPVTNLSPSTYTDPTSQISFQYPAGWQIGRGKTAIAEFHTIDHTARLSLDIPNLPFHFPGMITAGAVANGYLNDVKKRLTNPIVVQNEEIKIPDASARRVKITGTDAGEMTTDFAVLMVHADKVFILSSDGTGPSAAAAGMALDAAVQTLRWGK